MVSKSITRFLTITLVIMTMILTVGLASAETATYSSTYTAPYCSSGEDCIVPGADIESSSDGEPNNPNTIDSCANEKKPLDAGWVGTTGLPLGINITTSDGQINPGDEITIKAGFELEGLDVSYLVGFYFSENPNDSSPTWNKISEKSISSKDNIYHTLTETKTLPSSDGEYAVRVNIIKDEGYAVEECAGDSSSTSRDDDDVVFTASEPYTPPNIDSTTPINTTRESTIIRTNYTANDDEGNEGNFTVYYDENGTYTKSKSKTGITLSETGTEDITLTGLENNTKYYYKVNLTTTNDEVTSGEQNFTTLKNPSPNTEPATKVYLDTAEFNGNISVNGYEDEILTTYFQYRQEGQTEWDNTTKYITNTSISTSYSELMTGLPENTTYEFNLCIIDTDNNVYCDDKNQKVKTLERPTMNIDNVEILNNSTINVTSTITRNDATAGQPIFEYNVTGTYTGTNEKSTPEIITLFQNDEETETFTLTYDTESVGYGTNNLTITENYWMGDAGNSSQEIGMWSESEYEAPFQRNTTTTKEIETPTITIKRAESNDYDSIEWEVEINTSLKSQYQITIENTNNNTIVSNITDTTSELIIRTETITGLQPNTTHEVRAVVEDDNEETRTVTTEEREEPYQILQNDDITVNTYDRILLENLNFYTGDYWGDFEIYADIYKGDGLYKSTLIETVTTSENQRESTISFLETGKNVTGLEPDTTYDVQLRIIPQQDTSLETTSTTQTVTTQSAENPEIKDGNITDTIVLRLSHESNLTSLGTATKLSPYLQVREKNNPENEIIITPNGFDTETGLIKIIKDGSSYFLEEGENITEPTHIFSKVYELESDTEYEARMCVESDEWNTKNCTLYSDTKTGEQGVEGFKTLTPVRNYNGGITLRGETEDLHDARNVRGWFILEHVESGNKTNTTKFDIESAGTHSQRIENLTYDTKYEYIFVIEFEIDRYGGINTYESSGEWISFTSNVEKSMENIWNSLLEGSSWAKILMGVAITLSVLFVGVRTFGRSNMQLGTYGIMILLFTGALLSTIIGLFPTYILLLIVIGGIVLAVIKGMFFNNINNGE